MTKTMSPTYQVRRPGERSPARNHRTLRLFAVDVFLFVVFIAVLNVPLTGLAIHEWLGIGIAIALIVHLLQRAKWVITTTRRLMSATSLQNRVHYLLMVGLFIGFVSIIASGLLISEVALPWIGVTPVGGAFWLWLHLASVGWVIWLTAIHLAVNWRWIVSASDRLIFKRFARAGSER
ncbi:MAG: hypothetical protein U9N79_02185 [Actinomycetota bacterium]|nr:hypothetical protein [Actinomycetota bacterium]